MDTGGQRVSRTAQKGPLGLRQRTGNFPEASSVWEELGPLDPLHSCAGRALHEAGVADGS